MLPEDDLLREFVGNPRDHLRAWFDPQRPLMTGVVQNQDSYMKGRLGQRAFYDRLPGELDAAFEDWARLTGRRYAAVQPYRCEGAAEIIVAMGTMADTATAVVDHLRGLRPPRWLGRRDELPAVPGRRAPARRSAARARSR